MKRRELIIITHCDFGMANYLVNIYTTLLHVLQAHRSDRSLGRLNECLSADCDLENLEDGVDLRIAREESLPRRHLREDAPAGPARSRIPKDRRLGAQNRRGAFTFQEKSSDDPGANLQRRQTLNRIPSCPADSRSLQSLRDQPGISAFISLQPRQATTHI